MKRPAWLETYLQEPLVWRAANRWTSIDAGEETKAPAAFRRDVPAGGGRERGQIPGQASRACRGPRSAGRSKAAPSRRAHSRWPRFPRSPRRTRSSPRMGAWRASATTTGCSSPPPPLLGRPFPAATVILAARLHHSRAVLAAPSPAAAPCQLRRRAHQAVRTAAGGGGLPQQGTTGLRGGDGTRGRRGGARA